MTHKERLALRRANKKDKLTENLTPTEMDAEVENEPTGDVDPVDMLGDVLMAVTSVQTILERIEKMYAMELKAKYGWEIRHG